MVILVIVSHTNELSIKDVRSQEERGVCPVQIFCRQQEERGLRMQTSALFWTTIRSFRNLYCVRTNKEVWAIADKVGQIFAILCGSLLWTVPNLYTQLRIVGCFIFFTIYEIQNA